MSDINRDAPFLDFLWWEDFEVDMQFEYGAFEMQRDNMIAFATAYDPEPFHLDETEARKQGWDGLIASGLQIAAVWRRLSKDAFINANLVISPGWDNIRWRHPVFGGDVLSSKTKIIEKRELNSRPGEGLVSLDNQVVRQDGKVVASLVSNWFVRRGES